MPIRTIAGDCLVRFEGRRERTVRGRVLVVIKPDNTVLVHDVAGYQPVAWLTRPANLSVSRDPPGVSATEGDESLHVKAVEPAEVAAYEITSAGPPVGDCRCSGRLIRSGDGVACLGCGEHFGLPAGATMADGGACDCGLPTFQVDRGERFEVCLDRQCSSLVDAVRDAFDRKWDCPECGADLCVLRRGGLIVGCDRYPDCETAFLIPDGRAVDTCDCGLPLFVTASGERCLDGNCPSSG